MTKEEFAEHLRQLVGEAAEAGLSLAEIVEVLKNQAETMQVAFEE